MPGFMLAAALSLLVVTAPQPLTGLLCPGADLDGDGFGWTCDCNDQNPAIFPFAPQTCGDGVNNNCMDPVWPSIVGTGEEDNDNDGFRRCAGDCNDFNFFINPARLEVCNLLDDDCDGRDDAPLGPDADGDGFAPSCGDCDDTQAAVYPNAPQICDGMNNHCGSFSWPGVEGTNEGDGDGDTFTECAGDCRDWDGGVFPGAREACDGIDNDCDGRIDAPRKPDKDGDGYSSNCGDCDDDDATAYPGAPDLCGDGINNGCIPSGLPACNGDSGLSEVDDDQDGFTECDGDCQDCIGNVFPGAPQICDNLNNDCLAPGWPALLADDQDLDQDGQRPCDGDCSDYDRTTRLGGFQACDGRNNECGDLFWPFPPPDEADYDGDSVFMCQGDCDDTDPRVRPGAAQVCDGVNNDCLDPQWPALTGTNEADQDGDLWSPCSGDCDDANPGIFPGAPQICDGVNNNCEDPSWPSVPPGERDSDGDGHALCGSIVDCNDSLAIAWAPPGGAEGMTFLDLAFLQWSAPTNPGGSAFVFDLLRSDDPISFVLDTVCVVYSSSLTFWEEENAVPALDHVFSYVVRVRNFCPAGQNLNMGTDSAGVPRVGRTCP